MSLVEQLSDAMRILTTIAKDRGLAHTTEVGDQIKSYFLSKLWDIFAQVVDLDDESYKDFNGPLPQCKDPTLPPV